MTPELCRKWAEVTHEANKRGRPIQCGDAWVAATASLHGIPLVTHNRSDYSGVTALSIISEAPSEGTSSEETTPGEDDG